VSVEGSYAHVAANTSGLQVWNVADPALPRWAGEYPVPGAALNTAVAGDYVYVVNEAGPIILSLGPEFQRGDVNADGDINTADVIFLVSYLFRGGPWPDPDLQAGDANCDGIITLVDVIHLVNYVFRSGPLPGCTT
jgi:hypothetical protein